MHNILSDLWNGNLSVADHCGAYDPEIRELASLLAKNKQALSGMLSQEQLQLFETYDGHYEEYLLRLLEHAFCDGFRVALQLLIQGLTGTN